MGEPLGGVLPALRLLQLLPDSQNVARHACYGSGNCRSCVGLGRIAGLVVQHGPMKPEDNEEKQEHHDDENDEEDEEEYEPGNVLYDDDHMDE